MSDVEDGCLEDGSEIRVAEKMLTCDLCGGTIPVGARYETWLWAADAGRLRRIRVHRSCEDVRQEIGLDEWFGDEPLREWFWDWKAKPDENGDPRLPVLPLNGGFTDPELDQEWAEIWDRIREP